MVADGSSVQLVLPRRRVLRNCSRVPWVDWLIELLPRRGYTYSARGFNPGSRSKSRTIDCVETCKKNVMGIRFSAYIYNGHCLGLEKRIARSGRRSLAPLQGGSSETEG